MLLHDKDAAAAVAGVGYLDGENQLVQYFFEPQRGFLLTLSLERWRRAEYLHLAPGDPTRAIEGLDEDFLNGTRGIQLKLQSLPILRVDIRNGSESCTHS